MAGSEPRSQDDIQRIAITSQETSANEHDRDVIEELRRARHMSAFAGCILGGATAYISQIQSGGGGGDDELLIQGAGYWLAPNFAEDPRPMLRRKPVVYCHPSLLNSSNEDQLVLASDHRQLMNYLGFVTGGEQPPPDLVAFGTLAAVEDWAPGATIQGSDPGTLGAPCTSNGVAGILTAGHVTDGQPTVTMGTSTAKVLLEHHAGSSTTPLAVGPDFAVIELPAAQMPGAPLIPRTTHVPPSDPLTILGGAYSGNVLALATFMRVQSRSGCWGNVYQLDTSIAGPGDSGSAVIDSGGLLAGHYLGRLGGRWAVVQDVTYLSAELAKAGTTIP